MFDHHRQYVFVDMYKSWSVITSTLLLLLSMWQADQSTPVRVSALVCVLGSLCPKRETRDFAVGGAV